MYKALDMSTREIIRRNTLIDLQRGHMERKQTGEHTNYFFEFSNSNGWWQHTTKPLWPTSKGPSLGTAPKTKT
jgi:hypothetical protein